MMVETNTEKQSATNQSLIVCNTDTLLPNWACLCLSEHVETDSYLCVPPAVTFSLHAFYPQTIDYALCVCQDEQRIFP